MDILQLHAIENQEDKRALKKDGALQLLIEAQKAGKTHFLGITGHYDPEILNEFIDEYDFDTVLLPINPTVKEFEVSTIKKARKHGMGIIGMKIMARAILALAINPQALLNYSTEVADTSIVGCSNESDLEKNVLTARYPYPSEGKILIPNDIYEKARFFMKDTIKQKWPSTYQPDFPNIQYDS